jgi:hypothetical protein
MATYRGHEITAEKFGGDTIIWVVTSDGPLDVGSLREARETIDRILEKSAQLASSK